MLAAGTTAADDRLPGPSPAAVERLAAPVTLHWQDVPLQAIAARLEESQRLAVWLDRRIDPNQEVTLSLRDAPLEKVLTEIAAATETGYTVIGEVVYLGPKVAAAELRTLVAIGYEQAAQLPPRVRARLERPTALQLPRLSAPRDTIAALGRRAAVSIERLDLVPHDLWPAVDLPKMPAVEQLALLLIGFDLTWQVAADGRAIEIVPIERPVLIERVHSRESLANLPGRAPRVGEVRPGPEAGTVRVAARVEDHLLLAGQAEGTARRPVAERAGRRVYSLRVHQQPVGGILQQLARQLQMELDVEPAVAQDPDRWQRRVSFAVEEATLEELLRAAGEPAGLSATVENGTLRVVSGRSADADD